MSTVTVTGVPSDFQIKDKISMKKFISVYFNHLDKKQDSEKPTLFELEKDAMASKGYKTHNAMMEDLMS